MIEAEGSLIIRQHIALVTEGIGPRSLTSPDESADSAVLDEAVRVAGHLFDDHWDLWDNYLVSDEIHFPRCTDYRHSVRKS